MFRGLLIAALAATALAQSTRQPQLGNDPAAINLCYVDPDARPLYLTNNETSCAKHFYCPNITADNPLSYPQACPPSVECTFERLSGFYCLPQGRYEPVLCPRGFYCPDQKTKLVCPAGSWCPSGSVAPRACQSLSKCPEGSVKQTYYGGLAICLIIDAVLATFFISVKFLKRRRNKRNLADDIARRKMEAAEGNPDDSMRSNNSDVPQKDLLGRLITKLEIGFARLIPDFIIRRAANRAAKHHNESSNFVRFQIKPKKMKKRRTAESDAGSILDIDQQQLHGLVEGFRRGQYGHDLELQFRFENLVLTLPTGKTILNGVTGHISPGRVTVIMVTLSQQPSLL